MQVNSPTERRIIFSVWDSGHRSRQDRNKVGRIGPRTTLVAKGDGVFAGDFETKALAAIVIWSTIWKTGVKKQRFLCHRETGRCELIRFIPGYAGSTGQKKWMLISSWKAPRMANICTGFIVFVEDFDGANGYRLAPQGLVRQPVDPYRTTANGAEEQTTATFSCDPTGKGRTAGSFHGCRKRAIFPFERRLCIPGFHGIWNTLFTRPATGKFPSDVVLASVGTKHCSTARQ